MAAASPQQAAKRPSSARISMRRNSPRSGRTGLRPREIANRPSAGQVACMCNQSTTLPWRPKNCKCVWRNTALQLQPTDRRRNREARERSRRKGAHCVMPSPSTTGRSYRSLPTCLAKAAVENWPSSWCRPQARSTSDAGTAPRSQALRAPQSVAGSSSFSRNCTSPPERTAIGRPSR
jgi:hypothetical protein